LSVVVVVGVVVGGGGAAAADLLLLLLLEKSLRGNGGRGVLGPMVIGRGKTATIIVYQVVRNLLSPSWRFFCLISKLLKLNCLISKLLKLNCLNSQTSPQILSILLELFEFGLNEVPSS
jgi:hypothetical protein